MSKYADRIEAEGLGIELEPELPLVGVQTTLEVKKVANLIKTDEVEQNEVELE